MSFRLKSDTNLFEILKSKTTVSAIEVLYISEKIMLAVNSITNLS